MHCLRIRIRISHNNSTFSRIYKVIIYNYNDDNNDNDNDDNNNDNYNDADNDNDDNNDNNNDDDNDRNINHKGLQRTANEYAEERRIYKDLISQIEK